MDRIIPRDERRGANRRKAIRWGLMIALLVGLGYLGIQALRPTVASSEFSITTVDRGDVLQSIGATGLVVPAFEEQRNAPVATEIERVHLRSGAEVKQGDLILELDREYVNLQLEGRRDQLTLRQNNIALEKLSFDRDLKDLAIDAEVARLETSAAEAQLADAQRLEKVGGATKEDVERAELALAVAELAQQKLTNQLEYRRASDAGQRRRLELEVAMEEKEVAQLSRRLRETAVRAPRSGVVTWVNESIGQLVPEGEPLVRIADLAAFRVEAKCSDRYAGQLEVGMPVQVRLPKSRTSGRVATILPEVTNSAIRFLVELDDPSVAGLRPNQRVDVIVITDTKEDVVRIRNGNAIRGGAQQELFVVDGERAIRTPVTLGIRGNEYIEVRSGLSPRQNVIISDTRDYDGREVITLETAAR